MAVTVYKSSDGSAPVLTGQVGSLISLLDAVLVNGYGAKAAAGWTKPFSGTNLAMYRNASPGTQSYWRFDDASPQATAAAREAQFRGSEAASAISTQTGPFPTTTQLGTSGLAVRKSATADATARPWIVVADAITAYLFIMSGDFTGWSASCFGDIYSLVTSDAYRGIAIGRGVQNSPVDDDDRLDDLMGVGAAATIVGHYMPRHYVGQIQSAIAVGKHGDAIKSNNQTTIGAQGIVSYPNPADAALYLAQVWVHEDQGTQMVVRGRLRGFWQFLHPTGSGVNDQDTFSGTGALAGKTFLVVRPTANGQGLFIMETSNTWETN